MKGKKFLLHPKINFEAKVKFKPKKKCHTFWTFPQQSFDPQNVISCTIQTSTNLTEGGEQITEQNEGVPTETNGKCTCFMHIIQLPT